MFDAIRRDMRRYAQSGGWWRHPGFWAGATYRFGAWCHGLRCAPLRIALLVLYKVATVPWRLRSVCIPARARIGPGLCLLEPHNVLIAPETRIGEDFTVYHEVTIGRGPSPGLPVVGRGVTIHPGAKVLGGIAIGDAARVGANVVATRDVPAGATVLTAPARVIPPAMARRIRENERAR